VNKPKLEGAYIAGHKIVERKFFSDDRGSLLKVFEDEDEGQLSFRPKIKQINLVETGQLGTIRGMHVQLFPFAEMKLVTCLKGLVFDVVVDLRKNSNTFLEWSSCLLDASKNYSIIVPEGCAHGLQTLSEDVIMLYAHTNNFTDEHETGLNPLDPDLKISWPVLPIGISERDSKLPTRKEWLEKANEM
jgi:dTDP-4-dehydrorhamnose 3,5-epimerase